jgi:hypothetical protein
MDILKFIKEHQSIIAAVIGGVLAILAAYIRRDRSHAHPARHKPIWRLVLLPVLSLLLGAGLLAAENFVVNVDPDADLFSPDNPGALLCLGGCLLVSAGALWGFINFFRVIARLREPVAPDSLPATEPSYPANRPAPKPDITKKRAR